MKMEWLFGGLVPPNNIFYGSMVLPNNIFCGGTVLPNNAIQIKKLCTKESRKILTKITTIYSSSMDEWTLVLYLCWNRCGSEEAPQMFLTVHTATNLFSLPQSENIFENMPINSDRDYLIISPCLGS